jgi:hypothetical protein
MKNTIKLLDSLADCYHNLKSARIELTPKDHAYLELTIASLIEQTHTLIKSNGDTRTHRYIKINSPKS